MEAAAKHIVIVGAGIIGLAAALELADSGWRVTVLERGRAMREASWAAAGMLAVEDPENAPELLPLSKLSRELYPEFLARVERLSGMRVPLRTRQTLQGVHGSSEQPGNVLLAELQTDRFWFHVLEEASLDPRDLCAALPTAVRAAGVDLREEHPVIALTRSRCAQRPAFLLDIAGDRSVTADHVLLAGGAWAGELEQPWFPALPVAPRKGQMIEVTLDSTDLPCVIRTPELYLVPRGDGRVAIGATLEHAGFDRAIDEAAGDRLWQAAAELWPPILKGRVTARWTGLRPGYRAGIADALPAIGEAAGRLWVATGHFRNGILLAPGTAQLLRQMIREEKTSIAMAAFAPARFAPVAAV